MQIIRLYNLLLFILFTLLCIGSYSSIYIVEDNILFLLFILVLLIDVIVNPKRGFLNIIVLLTITLNILGVFAIEHSETNYYLYEVEQWISEEGSIPLLFLYQLAFLIGIFLIVSEKKIELMSIREIHCKSIFLFLLAIMLIVTYAIIAYYKPAPILGVDRFAYDKEILGKFGQITNILFYFSFGLGILFFKEKKKTYILLLLLIELAFLLKGHKFWNLIEILFLFFIPYSNKIIRRKVTKLFLILGISFSLLVSAAISINIYYFPSFEPLDYARQRLSQEGQLWWSTYKNYPVEKRENEFKDELKTYFNLNEDNQYDIGMYKVMQLNTTPERFEWKLNKLSRFTYSTPSLILYYLGNYWGIIAMLVCGFLSGLWYRLVIYTTETGNLLISLLAARLFYILRKGVKDGDLYKFFSIEFLLLVGTIFIIYLLYRNKIFFRNTSYNL